MLLTKSRAFQAVSEPVELELFVAHGGGEGGGGVGGHGMLFIQDLHVRRSVLVLQHSLQSSPKPIHNASLQPTLKGGGGEGGGEGGCGMWRVPQSVQS